MNTKTPKIGDTFDTNHETGCVATSLPDVSGMFTALDSDGIECTYCVEMVTRITGKRSRIDDSPYMSVRGNYGAADYSDD
jgi:hypothetical protein